jgi:uncharacterized protein
MIKEFWINLPVKDVIKAQAFYTSIGFKLNQQFNNTAQTASFLIGHKNVVMMLFTETLFKGFTQQPITDTTTSNEVLFNIDADNEVEVNELAQKIENSGGTLASKPNWNQGWMYGFNFCDLDGHRWNVLYMDMSKLPK